MQLDRYLDYKPAMLPWLTEVPKHWNLVPNWALIQLKKEIVSENSANYKLLSLTKEGVIERNLENPTGKFPANFDTYQAVEPGDLIFCLFDIDETPRTVGLSTLDGMVTGAYTRFTCNDETLRKFLFSVYLHLDNGKLLKPIYSGLRKVIPISTFLSTKSPVPPPEEQDAIVRFLDHADEQIRRYIAGKERLIALLQEERQALVHQAVTRGLDPCVRLKPSGVEWLGDVPEHWEVCPLKRAFSSMDYGISESTSDSGKIPVLTMAHVQDGQVRVPNDGGVDVVDPSLLLREGDLLFNRTNSRELVGKVGLFRGNDSPTTFASYLVRIRPYRRHNPDYLNMVLNDLTFLSHVRSESVPSLHQSNLNPTRYGRIHIALPPSEEQETILCALYEQTEGIRDSVTRSRRQIDLTNEYRTRLIADVVTGQLDVRETAAQLEETST